jgi:hypothetical protein
MQCVFFVAKLILIIDLLLTRPVYFFAYCNDGREALG